MMPRRPPVRRGPYGPPPARRIAGAARPLLALALAFGCAAPAAATSVRRMTLEQTTAAADRIVLARVEAVRSYWEGTRIWTEVTLAVGRTLKGERAARLTFVQLGGRVERPAPLAMTVPGAPIHRAGDEGYYFLEPAEAGRRVIVGLYRGHAPLRRDDGGPFVTHGGRRLAPADFEAEVRRAIDAGGAAADGAARPRGPERSGSRR
jgi:hypothetical protein